MGPLCEGVAQDGKHVALCVQFKQQKHCFEMPRAKRKSTTSGRFAFGSRPLEQMVWFSVFVHRFRFMEWVGRFQIMEVLDTAPKDLVYSEGFYVLLNELLLF